MAFAIPAIAEEAMIVGRAVLPEIEAKLAQYAPSIKEVVRESTKSLKDLFLYRSSQRGKEVEDKTQVHKMSREEKQEEEEVKEEKEEEKEKQLEKKKPSTVDKIRGYIDTYEQNLGKFQTQFKRAQSLYDQTTNVKYW